MKTPIRMTLIALAVILQTSTPLQADVTNGLAAYYPFSGNANDASGNGNTGTVVGEIGRAHV